MAEEKDDSVIIIEDGDDLFDIEEAEAFEEGESHTVQDEAPVQENKFLRLFKKYRYQLIFSLSLVSLIIFFAILFNTFSEEEEMVALQKKQGSAERIRESETLKKYIKKSDIEKLLSKANILYASGQQEKALDIYHQISLYNESISYYNLGVARLKERDYKNAYDAFKQALQNKENRTASAINAATCAREIGMQTAFAYYIDLAEASLPEEVNSPLYSYYYTLINYYKDRPIRAMSSIKAPTSDFFVQSQNIIAADISLKLDDYVGSLNAISKNDSLHNAYTLGLLHANIGEYKLAIEKLNEAIENNISRNEAKEAILLAYLKNSQFSRAASTINSQPKGYEWTHYPIEVYLKKRLFDIDLAQSYFSQKFFLDKEKLYAMLFYFSPYEIFNAENTFTQMKKGQVNLDAGEIELAKEFITSTAKLSNTNANIAIAIKLALNSHTAKANKLFARLNEKFENHDTLEYNLGLSFAQLGNYTAAYEHFRRAQFLNKSNVLAGIFALFCADLSGKDTEHIEKSLKKEIQAEDESIKKIFHQTLFNLYKDNFNAMFRWLEIEKEEDPLYLLTEILVADRINKRVIAVSSSKDLLSKFPDDIVTNILNLYVINKETSVKKYAFQSQQLMARHDLNFASLYYGPDIARDLYILMGQISGNLPKIKILLEKQMRMEHYDRENLLKAMGMTNILLQNFEEAFVEYNQLIDELKITDTKTLLNAAIAAIGAGHKENAIVLLEIAKMTDPRNFEARYGLGLLDQEVKNYAAAATQYGKIEDKKYQSRYFDFRIKEKK